MTDNRVRVVLRREAFTLDVDLRLPARGITGIFGASGSGKTSILRCVAGLEHPRRGFVRIAGETWQDEHEFVPAWQRRTGYVFQDAALFAHHDVRGNLEFARQR